jgi:hypothetical protein
MVIPTLVPVAATRGKHRHISRPGLQVHPTLLRQEEQHSHTTLPRRTSTKAPITCIPRLRAVRSISSIRLLVDNTSNIPLLLMADSSPSMRLPPGLRQANSHTASIATAPSRRHREAMIRTVSPTTARRLPKVATTSTRLSQAVMELRIKVVLLDSRLMGLNHLMASLNTGTAAVVTELVTELVTERGTHCSPI